MCASYRGSGKYGCVSCEELCRLSLLGMHKALDLIPNTFSTEKSIRTSALK